MPVFDTPAPIAASIDVPVANVRVIASNRSDTVVTVSPTRPHRSADVRAAERTTVSLDSGVLVVSSPRMSMLSFRNELIDIVVELPTASSLRVDVSAGQLHTRGNLGECSVKVSAGEVSLENTGPLSLSVSAGAVSVVGVYGDASVSTSSGAVAISYVAGSATVKSSNGKVELGEVVGVADLRLSNGTITIDRARTSVAAKTSRGSVTIGEVSQGVVSLQTGLGEIVVGIRKGVAAWLDVSSKMGEVRNLLTVADNGPQASEQTVEVRATTSMGAITVRPAQTLA